MAVKKQKFNITYIIIAGILGVAILGYGFLNYSAKQSELNLKKEEIRKGELEKMYRETKYEECMDNAFVAYSNTWESSCKSKGLEKDCSLTLQLANSYDDTLEKNRSRCVTLYKN